MALSELRLLRRLERMAVIGVDGNSSVKTVLPSNVATCGAGVRGLDVFL